MTATPPEPDELAGEPTRNAPEQPEELVVEPPQEPIESSAVQSADMPEEKVPEPAGEPEVPTEAPADQLEDTSREDNELARLRKKRKGDWFIGVPLLLALAVMLGIIVAPIYLSAIGSSFVFASAILGARAQMNPNRTPPDLQRIWHSSYAYLLSGGMYLLVADITTAITDGLEPFFSV
ncbi:hypothetical protein [Glutamicibacter ardleyensis]|uniref:hypothetical protein n=1 Tax=Glutamicibacter ardleyensis TaxID=225894 RepID=UPI003FD32ACD